MKRKVLIADECHVLLEKGLKNAGYELQNASNFSEQDFFQALRDASILVIRSRYFVDREFLKSAPNLMLLARLGSGMDNIDLAAANEKRLILLNSPEGNRDAVAEHVIGMLLSYTKNIVRSNQEVRQFIWKRTENRGSEIGGKTIGLIGYGNVGMALARKLSGFGCHVIAYDKYKTKFTDEFASEVDLKELQETADIISFHIPLTAESRNWVDLNFLKACPKKPILINAARGGILVLEDLLLALQSGIVSGACLDVLPNERFGKLQKSDIENYEKLFQQPNVVLSSHIAGWTVEAEEKMATVLLNKILAEKI